MRKTAKEYLNGLFDKVINKDCKVSEKDIEIIESIHNKHGVVFPEEIKRFYIEYNEVIKSNIVFKNIPNIEDQEDGSVFSKITLEPLISTIISCNVKWNLDMVLYYENEDMFLDGLIPIGGDVGGAIVCYKIDDKSIIEYWSDLEDKNDYKKVVDSFDELFEYMDIYKRVDE